MLAKLVLQVDVETYCLEAKSKLRGNATVLRCLVDNFKAVSEQCQAEMSRAVRLALWDYKPGAALTAACDTDVDTRCPRVSSGVVWCACEGWGLWLGFRAARNADINTRCPRVSSGGTFAYMGARVRVFG